MKNTTQMSLLHLDQCLYRKICGFKLKYDTDSEFALIIQMLLNFAFMPVDKVIESFETSILDSSIYSQIVNLILDYLKTYGLVVLQDIIDDALCLK